MLIRHRPSWGEADVTPQDIYLRRRQFVAGLVAAGLLPAAAARAEGPLPGTSPLKAAPSPLSRADETPNPIEDATEYNNYYEFGLNKDDPAKNAPGRLKTRPWSVDVGGLCAKPRVFDIEELLKPERLEERIYPLRCVEGWSVVIPWIGIPLAAILKQVEPTAAAKYVAFETLLDPVAMPGVKLPVLDWPYVEGLRIDEAMHPLTILAVGMYGASLPAQNGAPVRLVVPWKYGFKSIKSITRIRLVAEQPRTSWNQSAPHEYGFYSNVNPNVDHPRWSQAKERRLGKFLKIETKLFNGFADQVASLYAGMDLKANF